jgi:nucleoside-diphosphate-sugar epimerase
MRFFLTGATGFVGGVLARRLAAAGHEVHALARTIPPAVPSVSGVIWHRGDVTDRESLRRPMAGADGVFHVAGWYKIGARDRAAGRQVNVDGTRNVLAVMRELGIPKGVYTSTLAVNSDTRGRIVDETYRFTGRFISVYEETKAAAHDLALEEIARGLPLVIVQPGLVYGPGDTSSVGTTLRRFLRRQLPPLPAKTAFCWAHVDDIAEGHRLAMERGAAGRSYFLAGPVSTLVDAIRLASEITGIPAPRIALPSAAVKAGALFAGLVEGVVPLQPEFTREGLRTLAGTTYIGSSARARAELGWHVRPLADGLRETLRHEMRALGMPPI